MTKDTNFKRIGVEVDQDVWEKFREFVKENNKGRLKGLLSIHLENAMEEYMSGNGGLDKQSRFEPEDDNGGHPYKEEKHTHQQNEIASKSTSKGETASYIASMPDTYKGVLAKLYGNGAIPKKDFDRLLTTELHITTDKSRREHAKTFEHYGVLSTQKDRDDVYEVHEDVIHAVYPK